MNSTLVSRIYRMVVMVALLAALVGVMGGVGKAQAAAAPAPCLECRAQFTMTPGQTAVSAQPGQIVTIAIKLHNLSNLDRYVQMGATGSTLWPLQLSNDFVPLPAGGDAQVFLQVSVPATATDPPVAGDNTDHITVKATDNRNTVYTDLYITIPVNQ